MSSPVQQKEIEAFNQEKPEIRVSESFIGYGIPSCAPVSLRNGPLRKTTLKPRYAINHRTEYIC